MRAVLVCVVWLLGAVAAQACGPDSDCTLGDRTYRLDVAPGLTPTGALVFAHGYKGSAAGVMKNQALRSLAAERGWALVALKSAGDDWDLAHTPQKPRQTQAQEYQYIADVLADLSARHPSIERDALVLTGFSAGGMFTWTMACGASTAFAGFVPMSGTFWAPVPQRCPTPPARVVHIHGDDDGVVPLEGRQIGQTSQGSVSEAMAMYTAHAGLGAPAQFFRGDLVCQRQTGGKALLELCMFEGGHSFSMDHLRYGIDRVLGLAD